MEILRFDGVGYVTAPPSNWRVATRLPRRCLGAATAPQHRALSELAGHHPHGAGTHDLAFAHRQRAVRERERAPHAIDARARLDPVARLAGLEEVDGEAQ